MVDLGSVLKKARLEKGLTLEHVATAGGYSKALISRIENNNVFPSIDSLTRIADVLDLSLYDIFSSVSVDEESILRKTDRRTFRIDEGGFELQLLVPDSSKAEMLPVLYSGKPGAHSTRRMGEHIGQEWVIVLRGLVEIDIGGEKYTLKAGDSIYFNSSTPHRIANAGKGHAEGIAVTIPPNY